MTESRRLTLMELGDGKKERNSIFRVLKAQGNESNTIRAQMIKYPSRKPKPDTSRHRTMAKTLKAYTVLAVLAHFIFPTPRGSNTQEVTYIRRLISYRHIQNFTHILSKRVPTNQSKEILPTNAEVRHSPLRATTNLI